MRFLLHFVGLIAVPWIPGNSAQDPPVVETSDGPVRGVEHTSPHYFSFRGIPYAAPPIGDLRFADPKPPEKWTEVRDATNYGYLCLQRRKSWLRPMNEDCLTLNVFTPSVPVEEKDLKPVLVWIHGGGFHFGDSTDRAYGPEYLIGEDIVVVTINYRLGPLGFLTENTVDISGNWGLKDQVAALRWVQDNIARFGGDPKQVTIYGESAGGISVHLHLLSALSEGLFSKAIAASGAATMSTYVSTAEKDARYSTNLARLLGAEESDLESVETRIQFLRNADPDAMINNSYAAVHDGGERTHEKSPLKIFANAPVSFVPVIETPGTEGAFLTEEPRTLMEEGRFTKVPTMMGVTDLEGGITAAGGRRSIPPSLRMLVEENICSIIPRRLEEAVRAKDGCPEVAGEIRKAYFGGQPFNTSLLNFVYLTGDLGITLNVHYAQRVHARITKQDPPLYNYYFSFDGRWNLQKRIYNIPLPGAAHAEDLSYVFKPALRPWNITDVSSEAVTRNRMVRMLGNFVKYGDPTPEVTDLLPVKWEPATEDEPITLVINNELTLEKEFLARRMNMWDRLYKEYTGKALFG